MDPLAVQQQPACSRLTGVALPRTHLHALLAQVDAASQALARANVGVLILHKERLERLQLLLAEDGAVAPSASLWDWASSTRESRRASSRRG